MARAKREEQRIVRDQEIWEKRLLGWSQQQIADHLNVDQSLISRTLDRLEKQPPRRVRRPGRGRSRPARPRSLESVYRRPRCEQWERSCEEAEQVTTVTGLAKATEHGYVDLPDRETRTVKRPERQPGAAWRRRWMRSRRSARFGAWTLRRSRRSAAPRAGRCAIRARWWWSCREERVDVDVRGVRYVVSGLRRRPMAGSASRTAAPAFVQWRACSRTNPPCSRWRSVSG
jgi:hypothetical protein